MILIILLQLILFAIGIIFPGISTLLDIIISFSFVIISFILWRKNKYIYNKYTFWAMIFCCIGDLTTTSIIPLPNNLMGGIIVFSVAHILFTTGYIKTAKFNGMSLITPKLLIGICIYSILTILTWWFFIFNPLNFALALGALGYGLLICIMAAFALTLCLVLGKNYFLTAVGSAFFVLSDSIIGITSIKGILIPHSNILIWLTYMIALMGIIYSNSIIRDDFSGNTNKHKGVASFE